MSFVLSKIFWGLAAPGNFLLVLLISGFLALVLRYRRLGGVLVGTVMAVLLVIAVSPVPDWTIAPLEERFPLPSDLPDRIDGIIVLGGAVEPLLTERHRSPAVNGAADRMIEFAGLAHRYPQARLVFTGGSGLLSNPSLKEAAVAETVFRHMGLDGRRILFERDSRNTHENIMFSRRLVEPAPGEIWLLVTSAFHMPRAVGLFRAAEWPVIAYPVDYRSGGDQPVRFDLLGGLDLFATAIREWFGLLAYWQMGRIEELFPKPAPCDPT